MIRRALVALVVAANAVLPSVSVPAVELVTVRADVVSAAMFDDLLSRGYRGVPGDGAEALYVTRADALAACRSDLDCATADGAR